MDSSRKLLFCAGWIKIFAWIYDLIGSSVSESCSGGGYVKDY
jgi:hypothetical protein